MYDADGSRVAVITDSGDVTHYIAGIHTHDIAAGTEENSYTFSGVTVGLNDDGVRHHVFTDHLATVTGTLEYGLGVVNVERLRYLPYGDKRGITGVVAGDRTYTGQVDDMTVTGLMFYNARYYDPMARNFVSPDTIIPDPASTLGWNRYTYVNNNPINYSDPSGHCPYGTDPQCGGGVATSGGGRSGSGSGIADDLVDVILNLPGSMLSEETVLTGSGPIYLRHTWSEVTDSGVVLFHEDWVASELLDTQLQSTLVIDLSEAPGLASKLTPELLEKLALHAEAAGFVATFWFDRGEISAAFDVSPGDGAYEVAETTSQALGSAGGAWLAGAGAAAVCSTGVGCVAVVLVATGIGGYAGDEVGGAAWNNLAAWFGNWTDGWVDLALVPYSGR